MQRINYKILPRTYIVNHYITDKTAMHQLSQYAINFFNSDYSFHYLCTSESSVKELKKFLLTFAKKHAYFNVLYYDGDAIVKLLNTNKENIGLYDNGRYHIKLLGK